MVNKLALTILVSIILTVILISLVNVGVSLFLERPEWEDFCPLDSPSTQEKCEQEGGTWLGEPTVQEEEDGPRAVKISSCDLDMEECRNEYESALKPYNQIRYYIFAGIGFILLLVGLFVAENMIQLTGLATGGILVTQGIVMNFENKTIVFISLIAILIIFGVIAYRIIKKKD